MMTSLVTLSWDSTRGACSSPRRVLERRGRASVLGWTIRGSWRFLRCFCSSSVLCGPNGRKEMAWNLSLCINEFHSTWLENHWIYQASIKYYKRLRRFSQARKHPLYKLRVITLVCMMSYNLCKWPGAQQVLMKTEVTNAVHMIVLKVQLRLMGIRLLFLEVLCNKPEVLDKWQFSDEKKKIKRSQK